MHICYLLVDKCIRFTLLLGFSWILLERYIFIFLLFCFKMRICCRFTVRKQEVLLSYVGTPQWGSHGDNFTWVKNVALLDFVPSVLKLHPHPSCYVTSIVDKTHHDQSLLFSLSTFCSYLATPKVFW